LGLSLALGMGQILVKPMALSFIKHEELLEFYFFLFHSCKHHGKTNWEGKREKIHFLRCPSNYYKGNWSRSLGVQNAFQEEKANPEYFSR
jgi:hypothetical protein